MNSFVVPLPSEPTQKEGEKKEKKEKAICQLIPVL